jgi:RNA polymerase sigma factor (sigma-70 family)
VGNPARTLEPSRSDIDLLEEIRGGDLSAYVVLYERHVEAARRLARSMLRNQADADDVVSEVFASVLAVIQRDKGPRDGFAAYVMASVRNECYRAQRRRGRHTPVPEPTAVLASDETGWERDPFARHDEADALQQALQSLPLRFREVLWRTEVEGQSHQEIAEDIGTTPQAVAAQAMRARRALGGAYLRGHLVATEAGESLSLACADAREQLADLVRGTLSTRRLRRVDEHLANCASCRDAKDELERVNQHLRASPSLALVVGGVKSRVVGWLAASSAPLVAASGLVVVSAVVPLVMLHRSPGDDQVVAAAAPAAGAVDDPATTVVPTPRVEPDDHAPVTTSPPRHRAQPDDREPRRSVRHPRTRQPIVPVKDARPHQPRTRQPATAPAPPTEAVAPTETAPPPEDAPPEPDPPANTVLPPITVPAISTPPIEVPGVSTPAVSTPPVSLPVITVPSVTVPSITVPPITVPSVTVPPITVPPITVPTSLPAITVPPIGG